MAEKSLIYWRFDERGVFHSRGCRDLTTDLATYPQIIPVTPRVVVSTEDNWNTTQVFLGTTSLWTLSETVDLREPPHWIFAPSTLEYTGQTSLYSNLMHFRCFTLLSLILLLLEYILLTFWRTCRHYSLESCWSCLNGTKKSLVLCHLQLLKNYRNKRFLCLSLCKNASSYWPKQSCISEEIRVGANLGYREDNKR